MPEATFTSPVSRPSEAKYVVRSMNVTQFVANIEVSVQDSGNNEIRVQSFTCPDATHPAATVPAFFTALDTVRASEAGGVLARANFRILGFLFDNGYFPAVTLVP